MIEHCTRYLVLPVVSKAQRKSIAAESGNKITYHRKCVVSILGLGELRREHIQLVQVVVGALYLLVSTLSVSAECTAVVIVALGAAAALGEYAFRLHFLNDRLFAVKDVIKQLAGGASDLFKRSLYRRERGTVVSRTVCIVKARDDNIVRYLVSVFFKSAHRCKRHCVISTYERIRQRYSRLDILLYRCFSVVGTEFAVENASILNSQSIFLHYLAEGFKSCDSLRI